MAYAVSTRFGISVLWDFVDTKKNRHFLESFSLEGEIYYEVKFTHKIFDNII